jgi:hypothetical protein
MYIAACAAIVVSASYAFGSLRFGTGALVGAVVALLNWASLRWILRRVQQGSTRTRAVLMTLLVGKMGVLAAIVWLVIGRFHVHQGGFGLGLGALVVGLTLGGLASYTPDAPADPANEEH